MWTDYFLAGIECPNHKPWHEVDTLGTSAEAAHARRPQLKSSPHQARAWRLAHATCWIHVSRIVNKDRSELFTGNVIRHWLTSAHEQTCRSK